MRKTSVAAAAGMMTTVSTGALPARVRAPSAGLKARLAAPEFAASMCAASMFAALLSGCGQKGPLILPPPVAAAVPAASAPAAVPAAVR